MAESEAIWRISQPSVLAVFKASVVHAPERIYCKDGDLTLTYAEAGRAVAALADDLKSARGRDVLLVLPNSAAFLVAYFAVLAAGGRPALVNYAHPDATLEALVKDLDVATVLSGRDIPGLDVTLFDHAAVQALLERDAPTVLPENHDPEAIAAILFTGGTTGLPKRIAHSNRAIIAKMERVDWGWPSMDGDVWLPVAPFTHVYGFLMGVVNPVLRAGTLTLPRRFHPDLIVDMLQDDNVTLFGGGPPAIYQAVMASTKFADASFPKLRIAPGGGAPFPLDVHRRWQDATGMAIHEGYGMTEIAPIAVNPPGENKPGSAGKPPPDTVIEIVDLQDGSQVLPVGEIGEVRVRGPHMMRGYERNPEETAIAVRDGYIYTGDIGSLDSDGFLTISDRKKDVIFVKGYNVFPRDVEEVLMQHPEVTGACVVGRPDERAGEVPVAFVTGNFATEQLLTHCGMHLAGYKRPVEIRLLDALPLTPAGKVDRAALRAEVSE